MTHFFLDFDSTIISGEILDILADISLENNPMKVLLCKEISEITEMGMLGNISFSESLTRRLPLLHAHQHHIQLCIEQCKSLLTPSFQDFCRKVHKQ
jgi:D-3-phosphoglycerate dehydrogenase